MWKCVFVCECVFGSVVSVSDVRVCGRVCVCVSAYL